MEIAYGTHKYAHVRWIPLKLFKKKKFSVLVLCDDESRNNSSGSKLLCGKINKYKTNRKWTALTFCKSLTAGDVIDIEGWKKYYSSSSDNVNLISVMWTLPDYLKSERGEVFQHLRACTNLCVRGWNHHIKLKLKISLVTDYLKSLHFISFIWKKIGCC